MSPSRSTRIALVLAALTGVAASTTQAAPIVIDWVTVGNGGNANDPATGDQFGGVADDYRIMRFEFTNSEYVAFLNAIDPAGTNPNSVFNSNMSSDARGGISQNLGEPAGSRYAVKANMGDKPVNYVSWFSAARVSNWLHNGAQAYGSTDSSASAPQNTGAYSVGTATSGEAVAVNPGALFYVPTESQWYKAAYYNPTLNGGTGGYRVYGNGFDAIPGIVSADAFGVGSAGGTGSFANYSGGANWNDQNGNVTTVGTNGAASYYGAFDMSGNVFEWNDFTGAAGSSRGLRGGDFRYGADFLASSGRIAFDPSSEIDNAGFRLAGAASAVPEIDPAGMGGVLALVSGVFGLLERRRQRA